jgi:hypothetical protein
MRTTILVLSSLIGMSVLSLGCSGDPGADEPGSSESEREANPCDEAPEAAQGPGGGACCATTVFDDKYADGHAWKGNPTPILPPGQWDWDPSNHDLANWKNFQTNVGTFELLTDIENNAFGWKLLGIARNAVDFAGPAAYFEGSSGRDIVNLGSQGRIHSMSGSLGAGPDVLVYNESWSLDFSTSSGGGSAACDDDIVVAGCDENADGSFDIETSSIHTGAGDDLLFIRDAERSGFDAGNLGGDTSALDPEDGDDTAVFRGNMLDFRFFGGAGNDTAVWYVDEVKQENDWLGPNFFGGGGAGAALWGDPGVDRLVLVIPDTTEVISKGATKPGQLLVRILKGYKNQVQWDGLMEDDPKAKYCVTCGTSPAGEKTITLEYRSADGSINTGYFWVTAFEELQLGIGAGARVYSLDDVTGSVTLNPALTPTAPPALDPAYCAAN